MILYLIALNISLERSIRLSMQMDKVPSIDMTRQRTLSFQRLMLKAFNSHHNKVYQPKSINTYY